MLLPKMRRYRGQKIGNYTIVHCVGQGRYGVCFAAEENGEKVIIKKMKPHIFKRNRGKNEYEIQILSRLRHGGIPKLLGTVNEKDFYGIVLESKDGDTLEKRLFTKKQQFSAGEISNIGGQLIEIIGYLHENGVVHRDIRIPNILIHDDRVSLIDFGLARWADGDRYAGDMDYSYLGDVLLYLLYSTYQKENRKSRPWYEELPLSTGQRLFLKRLLRLEAPYQNIHDIAADFQKVFGKTLR